MYIIRLIRERLERTEAWLENSDRKKPGPLAMLNDALAYRDEVMQLIRTRQGIIEEEEKIGATEETSGR
ncbi:MAG: hypothetical protein OCU12_07175 [Methanophagales archaeon]|nr:hypothetical protein [Methanophagales archaeon]